MKENFDTSDNNNSIVPCVAQVDSSNSIQQDEDHLEDFCTECGNELKLHEKDVYVCDKCLPKTLE